MSSNRTSTDPLEAAVLLIAVIAGLILAIGGVLQGNGYMAAGGSSLIIAVVVRPSKSKMTSSGPPIDEGQQDNIG